MKRITFSSGSNLNNRIYKIPPRSLLEGSYIGKENLSQIYLLPVNIAVYYGNSDRLSVRN